MKRRTPRQLVHLLSDIHRAQRCTALRAAAASRDLERTLNASDARDDADPDDAPDATRDPAHGGISWSKS